MASQPCPNCGADNPADARLCGMCGAALRADEAAGAVHREVTLVTSDLKGSTALGERLDPEALREVLNRYFDVMRAVFESHGGTIEKIIGDAIVAVFGLPFRHEDDPLRAVEAAAESQRALATLNDELEQGWNVRLVVRTGVATGEVTFGKAEGGQHVLLGEPVETSTVMEQNAPSLEVLLAASTYDRVSEHVEAVAVPPVSPKDSYESLAAYRLVAVRERASDREAIVPEAGPGMRICPSCGEQSPDRMRLCNVCGASLSQAVAKESRRTVTIVFAMPKVHSLSGDSVGSETLRDVMSRYFDGMREALERHGGTVEKFIGDAVMAVFGLPVRHEDDALRAVRAAADMQDALERLNPEFRADFGLELSNHVGVNSGEVIAGDASTAQRLVTGDAVNTAARLEQAAGSGDIVLGDLTYRLAREQIDVELLEPLSLKGKAEPVPAYRLVRVKTNADSVERSHGTPFVGRDAEMARLGTALDAAISTRTAQLAAVVGDAGVGKSRLIREFAVRATERARLIRGRCLPYGDGITFWPLAEAVRDAAAITAEDSPRVAIRRIDQLLELAGGTDREPIVERVAAAINLSDAKFPVAELMWGGRRLLETLAAERPIVLLVDDLHWAESTFLEFLDHLLEAVADSQLLILGSSRHELTDRHADWANAHRSMLISLQPLSDADAGAIVEELLGSLDESVRSRIAGAAEGNPLYVEQIVSMLVETGAIERGSTGWVARAGPSQLLIPPTVQALVASRLDALQAEERAVVDPASVIGLTFALEAITDLVDDTIRPGLPAGLDVLTTKQLVRQLEDEEVLYRFGHQIIRDTAYGSLLKRSRAAIHERFVTWAERVNRERGRELEFEEILGYHLEQAYRYRTELGVIDPSAIEVGDRAAAKLASAGRRALERGDLSAGVSLLRRSVALLERQAPTRVELLVELGDGLLQQGAFDDARTALVEAEAIATEIDDARLRARARLLRASVDAFSGVGTGHAGAIEVAESVLPILEAASDAGGLARAWRAIMYARVTAGELDAAAMAANRVASYAKLSGDRRLGARSAPIISYVLVHGSLPVDQAAAQIDELMPTVAGDRKSEAILFLAESQLRAMEGRGGLARDLYRRGQEILAELGTGMDASTTSIEAGRVEVILGDFAAAERELRRDFDSLSALGETYYRSTIAAMLAAALVAGIPSRAQVDEALRLADVASQLAEDDDYLSQVLWRLARARALSSTGRHDDAIEIAQQAVMLTDGIVDIELRADALAGLGRILAEAGRSTAVEVFRQALPLYTRKGDVLSAARVREELAGAPEPVPDALAGA